MSTQYHDSRDYTITALAAAVAAELTLQRKYDAAHRFDLVLIRQYRGSGDAYQVTYLGDAVGPEFRYQGMRMPSRGVLGADGRVRPLGDVVRELAAAVIERAKQDPPAVVHRCDPVTCSH